MPSVPIADRAANCLMLAAMSASQPRPPQATVPVARRPRATRTSITAHTRRDSHSRRFWPRPAIMRHDPGLAASPPVRYMLKVEGSEYSPFPDRPCDGQPPREAAARRIPRHRRLRRIPWPTAPSHTVLRPVVENAGLLLPDGGGGCGPLICRDRRPGICERLCRSRRLPGVP